LLGTVLTSCSLLTPIGDHRRTHVHPSKGKKRKRTTKSGQDDAAKVETSTPPPAPEIGKHVLIGLNSVTRQLEAQAAKTAPSTALITSSHASAEEANPKDKPNNETIKPQSGAHKHISMVIITHPKPSLSPAHAHLPTLLHLANLPLAHSPSTSSVPPPPTRLIPLPTSTDARLASTLHIPRVGALAVFEGAPGAKALEEYVREHVGVTECKWVDEAMKGEWKRLNIKSGMDEKK
jgi:ribonuclease P/MRP protein subunit POP3